MQYVLLFVLFSAVYIAPGYTLSCLPCHLSNCSDITCPGSKVKEPCGCCDECAKQVDESCGGPWDIDGKCDKGLVCLKAVGQSEIGFNIEGTCTKNDTRCPLPMKFTECASACQPDCDERTPRICTLQCVVDQCVCSSGFIRRSATNRTCIPVQDCPVKSCQFPKIFSQCATSCPATCENPYAPISICTRQCSVDPCLCPKDYVMKSLTDRRCIKAFECEDFSFCKRDCPALDFDASTCELAKSWSCELQKWKCTSYEWRMSVEKWWNDNDCVGIDVAFKLWDDIPDCEYMPLDCINAANKMCFTDALGCWSCECTDGKFADISQIRNIWMRNMKMYQFYFAHYKKARALCTATSSVGCDA